MSDMSSAAISSFASEKPIDDLVESSRIDDLLLEQINILRAEIKALKKALNESEELRGKETAELRRRLASLEHREPLPSQERRGETLLAILASNGGKMLLKDARRQMELDASTFSRLLASMEDAIGSKDYRLDRRQSLIFIK